MRLLRDHPLVHAWLRRHLPDLAGRAFELRLNWAEEVELTGVIEGDGSPYFVGGETISTHRADAGDYRALSAEECLALRHYRAFRLYEPWPQPEITVVTSEEAALVTGAASGRVSVLLKEIGSAQVWWGADAGVVWEVLLDRDRFPNPATFRVVYMGFWGQAEAWLAGQRVRAVVTEHSDPQFETDWYQDVLRAMGYRQVDGSAFRKEPLRPDPA